MGTHRLAMKLPTSLALLVGVVAWVGISSALPVPSPKGCVGGAKDVDCSDDASGGKIGDGMEPLKTKIGTIIKVRDLKVDAAMKSEDQAKKPSHASDYTEDDEITLYPEFKSRYNILGASLVAKAKNDKAAAGAVLDLIKLPKEKFRLGHTKVFFRAGILGVMEETREDKIGSVL